MITFRKLEDTLVGTVNGKPFNLPRTDENIAQVEALKKDFSTEAEAEFWSYVKNNRNLTIAGSNKFLEYNPVTKEYFLRFENKVSKHPIIPELVTFIEESHDKDIDFTPVIKAWARLLENPRYNEAMGRFFGAYLSTAYVDKDEVKTLMEEHDYTEEYATKLATYQDIAITQEGLLATYKVAEEVTWEYVMEENEDGTFTKVKKDRYKRNPAEIDDVTGDVLKEESFQRPEHKENLVFTPAIYRNGDKFFSGEKLGYVYEIGKMQFLPKNARRNLSNNFGGGGLYIGGLKYVEGYRSSGTHVLTCFVNPRDILSFQSEGHAIRVDALFPNNVWEEDIPLKGAYHSSDYDKMSEDRINDLMAEAVKDGIDIVEFQRNAQGLNAERDDIDADYSDISDVL